MNQRYKVKSQMLRRSKIQSNIGRMQIRILKVSSRVGNCTHNWILCKSISLYKIIFILFKKKFKCSWRPLLMFCTLTRQKGACLMLVCISVPRSIWREEKPPSHPNTDKRWRDKYFVIIKFTYTICNKRNVYFLMLIICLCTIKFIWPKGSRCLRWLGYSKGVPI